MNDFFSEMTDFVKLPLFAFFVCVYQIGPKMYIMPLLIPSLTHFVTYVLLCISEFDLICHCVMRSNFSVRYINIGIISVGY